MIAAFGKEFAKTGLLAADFHAHLREAAEARNISDYQAISQTTEEAALLHISRAEQFLAGEC